MGCGAPLHCEAGAAFVTCAHCGTRYAGRERAGELYVEAVAAEDEPAPEPTPAPEPPAKPRPPSGTAERGPSSRALIIALVVVCGVLVVSCLLCVLGVQLSQYKDRQDELRDAEKLLEEGKIGEAEEKFRELGKYGNYAEEIEAKKREKHAELVREADKACEKGDYELALKLYEEAGKFSAFDEETEAKYKRAGILMLKRDVPTYLDDARGHLEGANYDVAAEEADKAIKACDDLEEKAPDVAKEIDTAKIKKDAAALKEEIAEAKEKAEREKAFNEMGMYQRDEGDIGVAVSGCKLSKRVSTGYGFYRYVKGDARYVWVGISVKNYGRKTVHVNPNDFTLSTPSGYTCSHDAVTYSLGNYFDAVNLPGGGTTGGWIIFISHKEDHYRLNYESWGNRATKTVFVTEGK